MLTEEQVNIFISFSFSDEVFAKELSKLLKKICKNEKSVYCVAENNNYNAVKYGQDFSEDFIKKVKECKIFIPLLSINYLSSVSSIIELGAALGTDKTILPILLPGIGYHDMDKLYNLRNREYYNIDNQPKFRKCIDIIREQLELINYNEADISEFYTNIDKLKKKYLPLISKDNKCLLICEKLSDASLCERDKFKNQIIQDKLVETIVCEKVNNKIIEYNLYMWHGKTVGDLQLYLDKNGYENYIIDKLD